MQDRQKQTRGGFTLIELLVVVAIISMLIALFSVGTKKVKIISKGLQQKSVFHAMTVGLELFSKDFDGYPNSQMREQFGVQVTGAQHLAEALLGRDWRGFEPRTGWFPMDDTAFGSNVPADIYTDTTASLARRKGPYCEIKYGQVLMPIELWSDRGPSKIYLGNNAKLVERSPVITDVFNRNDTLAGRTGMPILYFRGDSTKPFRVDSARQTVLNPSPAQYRLWAYNFDDNLPVLQLPWLRDTTQAGLDKHFRDPDDASKNHAQVFYERITQQANPDQNFYKPYNASTFILISAGWDGIFGTKDDIVNYD
jgi:prepilin-type N-terminal cleavage/methylation domain-containing protein